MYVVASTGEKVMMPAELTQTRWSPRARIRSEKLSRKPSPGKCVSWRSYWMSGGVPKARFRPWCEPQRSSYLKLPSAIPSGVASKTTIGWIVTIPLERRIG